MKITLEMWLKMQQISPEMPQFPTTAKINFNLVNRWIQEE
jgi:hypothetical protein